MPLSINESRARTKGKGKIEDRGIQFVAFGGDGGTYDIGLQSLSGALEWLQFEGRFKHLFVNGNEQIVEEIQAEVDRRLEMLLARSETKAG